MRSSPIPKAEASTCGLRSAAKAAAPPLDAARFLAREEAMDGIIESPSPNFDERRLPVSMLVLHYTGMEDAASAIARLKDPEAKVSAHYLVAEDGQVLRLVDESKRAWHAGRSFWRGLTDINSASVGIEIVNPGH